MTLRVFTLISVIFALTEIAAVYSAVVSRAEVRSTVATAVMRVELVSRMGRAIDRERILVDAHIFEKQPHDMAALEQRIADIEQSFDRDAVRYGRLQRSHPVDDGALGAVVERVRDSRDEVQHVLALSRANLDLEARNEMNHLETSFDATDESLAELIRVNDQRSETAARRTSSIQLASIAISTGFAFAAVVASIGLGMWASRIVGERELESVRHAHDLEERNRDLDAFAGRVAHDLRGPLTTIGLAGARLAQMAPGESGTAQILARGVSRMEALIGDLLSLSRIATEAGRGRCDPAEIAAQVREDLAPAAERATVSTRYEIASATIECSPVLFRQVLSNLVENGVKYRRSDGDASVSVVGRVTGREYVLCVADNGLGMEPDVAAKIFQPFYRSPHVAHLAGTGLGLSIVKRIVDASGGTITVDSSPGRGTTFIVRFAVSASVPGLSA